MSEGLAKAEDKAKAETSGNRKKQSNSKSANKVSEPSLNMSELYELANLVDEHGFTDFEFENANIRVRLSKNPAPQMVQAVQPYTTAAAMPQQNVQPSSSQAEAGSQTSADTAAEDNLHKIVSPIVGTFYRSPSPDKDPYINEGSKVTPETTVCIVEAMKLMNEIQAEVTGEVVKIYVENGQPVEYGQPLFGIKQ